MACILQMQSNMAFTVTLDNVQGEQQTIALIEKVGIIMVTAKLRNLSLQSEVKDRDQQAK